jgi:hypothetical protein
MDIHPSTEDQALMLFLHTNDRGGWSQQNLFGNDQLLSEPYGQFMMMLQTLHKIIFKEPNAWSKMLNSPHQQ